MIIKKDLKNIRYPQKILTFFKKFINLLGYIFLIFIILGITYYFSSNLHKEHSPSSMLLKINDKILDRYLGLNFRNSSKYIDIIGLNLTKYFRKNNLQNFYLTINQKSILGLELQRQIKEDTGGPIPDELKLWFPAKIKTDDKEYKVKIKLKGNRFIHWYDKNKTSYKIDLRGSERILNMEEFSLQKPITKNYTYEYLFHKLLGFVDLININYSFINLYFNDQNLGVYAIEESFSKDLLLRKNKNNGPIFSIKDELGELFPNIFFELYSRDYWLNKDPKLVDQLFLILNQIRDKKIHVNEYFDIEKWAKYFAIMDLTGAYHGSLLDSVKLYFNPETQLFEPIGYDLHKGAGNFDDFILSDILDSRRKPKCSWICDHKDLYNIFFRLNDETLNQKFLEKYIYYLQKYSETNFLKSFLNLHKKELSVLNKAIYQDNSKTDLVRWIGAGFFVYDEEYLIKRSVLINSRINSIKLDKIMISKYNDFLFYEDFLMSNFPVKASTENCEKSINKKNFYFIGRMKFELVTDCSTIKIEDYNNNFVNLELKNNPEINF